MAGYRVGGRGGAAALSDARSSSPAHSGDEPRAGQEALTAAAPGFGSVSKKTSFVVEGSEAARSSRRAAELGVPVLDEQQLIALLAGDAANPSATSGAARPGRRRAARNPRRGNGAA